MRARNIKPSFFVNDELAQVEPLGRLLFAGLWCMADRAGRLEDRPLKIKASILPFDNCNVDLLLASLASHDFILRYEQNKKRYIEIVNFVKHQSPHIKEQESTIQAPGKNRASTRQTPYLHPLNPLSPFPFPESPIPVTPSGVRPYPIPDPKTEPQKCLVLSYKSRKGVPYNNRDWDKGNFGRCMAAAGTLLGLCRDLASAEACLNDLAAEYESKSLTWTLETVARNAPDWLQKNGRTDANASRAGLRLAIAQRKTEGANQTGLVKIAERAVSHAIRDGPLAENGNEKNGERPAKRLDVARLD